MCCKYLFKTSLQSHADHSRVCSYGVTRHFSQSLFIACLLAYSLTYILTFTLVYRHSLQCGIY